MPTVKTCLQPGRALATHAPLPTTQIRRRFPESKALKGQGPWETPQEWKGLCLPISVAGVALRGPWAQPALCPGPWGLLGWEQATEAHQPLLPGGGTNFGSRKWQPGHNPPSRKWANLRQQLAKGPMGRQWVPAPHNPTPGE